MRVKELIMNKQIENNIDISIVVPVYNTEKYVTRCLNSILRQNVNNYEIIVVDDCSTDHSYEIVQSLARQHEQIKLYRNEKNMGAGYTKNRALSFCKGKYICFSDSDDWLIDGALNNLFELAEKMQCDDIFYEMYSVSEHEDINVLDVEVIVDEIYERGILLFERMLDEKKVTVSACHHFLRRSCLNDQTLFSENSVNDDWNFTVMLFCNVKKIVSIKNKYYVYWHREQGSISCKANSVSLIDEIFHHAMDIYDSFIVLDEIYERVRKKCFIYMMVLIQNEIVNRKLGWEKEIKEVYHYITQAKEIAELFEESKCISQYGVVNAEVLKKLKCTKNIYIFGAGSYGKDAMRIIQMNGMTVKAFVVSHERLKHVDNIPVYTIDEIVYTEDSFFVIAVSDKYKREICDIILKKGIVNYGCLIEKVFNK